jgi:hypothetical protein
MDTAFRMSDALIYSFADEQDSIKRIRARHYVGDTHVHMLHILTSVQAIENNAKNFNTMNLLALLLTQTVAVLFAHEYAELRTNERKGDIQRSIFAADPRYQAHFTSNDMDDINSIIKEKLLPEFETYQKAFNRKSSRRNKLWQAYCTVSLIYHHHPMVT